MHISKLASHCALGAAAFVGTLFGQDQPVLPLASEPHHHLALHNDYVNVYNVTVSPGDSVRLHRHDTDAISLSLSESLVTLHSPGKPDVQQKLKDGQIRLQPQGFVHSTRVDGDVPFRNVTVELLLPQTGKQNGCAEVMAGQPLHCADTQGGKAPLGLPQFETGQTYVGLLKVASRERVVTGEPGRATLIVALDNGAVRADNPAAQKSLSVGDFLWTERGEPGPAFRNDSAREVRLIIFAFTPKP